MERQYELKARTPFSVSQVTVPQGTVVIIYPQTWLLKATAIIGHLSQFLWVRNSGVVWPGGLGLGSVSQDRGYR